MRTFAIAIIFAAVVPACGDDSGGGADLATGADMAAGGTSCTAARAQLLGSIDSVSTGDVAVIATNGAVRTLYVDASAGGLNGSSTHPWTFVNLGSGGKVAVTDKTSVSSSDWDLALKRPVIYTNSGDGGPGHGGAVHLFKDFALVTAADAAGATFLTETFFDATCKPNLDPTNAVETSFSDWYQYDAATHMLTPAAGTFLVRGAGGALYAVQITTYYGSPSGAPADGGTSSSAGGTYVLEVKALQ